MRKIANESPVKSDFKLYDTVIFETDAQQKIEQKLWPAHCVEDTHGAEFHPNLFILEDPNRSMIVKKGTNSNIDSYSAFFDNIKTSKTGLGDDLKKAGITDIYVCGLATDVCVSK